MASLQPSVWLEMILEPYPTATATTYRWAARPFADAGSWKEGRLASLGPIERALSDDDGNYERTTVRATLDDTDGLLRGLLSTQATSYFTGREASLYLLSEAGRRAGTTPRLLFRGRVTDVQLLPERQVSLEIRDLVGSAFSGFDLEKTIPQAVLGSEHANLPDDSRGLVYPIIYGEHSDRGAVDVNGATASRGRLPVIDTGDYHPFGDEMPTVYVTPPQNLVGTLIGSGSGTRTYSYAVTAITGYGETTISNIVSVSGCPDSLDSATYVELTWDAPATGASAVIAYRVCGRTANPPNKYLEVMNNGGTYVSPETTYRDGRQGTSTNFDTEKTPGPPATNTAQIESGNMAWGRLLVSLGSVDVRQVFGSNLADGTAASRVELDIDGPDVVTSRSAAWPHSDPYIDVGGIRQTVIYMIGPRLEAHRNGSVTVAVNACGYEDVGDGSGTMISQAFFQLQHLLNEHVFKNDGAGYRSGTWGPLETYTDGNECVQTSKFTAAQNLSISRIGGSGYLGAIALHEATPLREVVRRFNVTFDSFLGANHHGQIFPALIDEVADPTAGRHYRDRIEMVKLDDQRFDHEAIETKIVYDYDWDADAQAFRVRDQFVEDATAAAALKADHVTTPQELYYTRDAATARDSRLRRLFRHRRAPRYVRVTGNLMGLEDELADPMRLTHYNGLGATGDVNTPGFIRRHRVDGDTTTLEMLDLRRMGTLLTVGGSQDAGEGVTTVRLSVPSVTLQPSAVAANRIAFVVPAAARSAGTSTRAAGTLKMTLTAPSATLV